MDGVVAVRDALAAVRSDLEHAREVVVAFSGGLDSTVLLHAVRHFGIAALRAVHVDHGLQPAVRSRWLEHVASACDSLAVPLTVRSVTVSGIDELGPEAAARDARYRVLAEELTSGGVVLSAHHADDQAETVLLQLMRGSGPAGLAAMPAAAPLGDGSLLRPLLGTARAALIDYARREQLDCFEDPSNADTRLDRNYLRAVVAPQLAARWPGWVGTVGRSARLQAEAEQMSGMQALRDWRAVTGGDAMVASCQALAALGPVRLRHAVRYGLRASELPVPNARRLAEIEHLVTTGTGRGLVQWPGGSVRLYRDGLHLLPPLPPPPAAGGRDWDGCAPLLLPTGYGQLRIRPTPDSPLALHCRFREGGERVTVAGRPSRAFARWCQEAGVPPWARNRVPLLFADAQLLAIGTRTLPQWRALAGDRALLWEDRPAL